MYRQPNYVTKEEFSLKISRRTIKVFYIYISSQCYFLKLPPTLMFSLFKRDFVWQYWLGAYYCRPTLTHKFIKTKSTTLLNFEDFEKPKWHFSRQIPIYIHVHTYPNHYYIKNYFSGLHNNYSLQINHGWGTDSWSWRRPVHMVAPLLGWSRHPVRGLAPWQQTVVSNHPDLEVLCLSPVVLRTELIARNYLMRGWSPRSNFKQVCLSVVL